MTSFPSRFLAVALVLPLASSTTSADLVLSEFLAVNSSGLLDGDGDPSDWIEVWNDGPLALDLSGWFLSDDAAEPNKWSFGSAVFAPGERRIVFASGKDLLGPAGEIHTSFQLDGDGEDLLLVRPNGVVVMSYLGFPPQLPDTSYGVGTDLGGQPATGYLAPPSPGLPNGAVALPVDDVEFSEPRGYHDAPFSLGLACDTPNALIRYTLDASEPNETSTLYTGPVPIAGTAVVRARGFRADVQSLSRSTTSTYLFPDAVLAQSDASAQAAGFPPQWIQEDGVPWSATPGHPGASYGLDPGVTSLYTAAELEDALKSLPTVALSMSIDDWFGYNPPAGPYGIYPNSTKEGDAWDRACSFEYFDPSGGGEEIQVNCGVAVQGGSSTSAPARGQLSLALKFKSQFGVSELELPLFEGSPVDHFDYLILDGGNEDGLYSGGSTTQKKRRLGVRDQAMAELQRDLGWGSMYGDHVHLFLNGLYWGMYNLHERPDERWAADHGPGSADEYDWVKEGFVLAGNPGDLGAPIPGSFAELGDVTANGLSDSDTYGGQAAYEVVQDHLDLAAYADYLLLNFYGGNVDWPQQNWMGTNHARLSADLADKNPEAAWRFQSWDAEATISMEGFLLIGDGFYDRTGVVGAGPTNAAWYYTELRQNSEFPVLMADRAYRALLHPDGAFYVDPAHTAPGTAFDPAHPEHNRAAAAVDSLAERVELGVRTEFARWGNYFYASGQFTPADWEAQRTELLTKWFPQRSGVVLAQLRNAGLYPSIDAPVFSQLGGTVPSGFGLVISAAAGTVYATTDGSDPRLPGGAVAPTAFAVAAPIPILAPTTVRARAFDGVEWSALVEAAFATDLALRINEVLASNEATLADEQGEFEDYVEIHNASGSAIDVGGMYLSDDLTDPTKWRIPASTVVPAGGHVLVWADDDPLDGPLHATFKLDKSGEEIGLFHADEGGNLQIDAFAFGPQADDVPIGSMPDGGAVRYRLLDPSPASANRPAPGAAARFDSVTPNPFALATTSVPAVGQVLSFSVSGAPAGAPGAVFLGLATTEVPYGASFGLVLPVVPEIWPTFLADASGVASPTFAVPAIPSLGGLSVFWQAWALPGILSRAVAVTLSP